MHHIKLIIILFLLILSACSKDKKISENYIENKDLETEMIKAYNEGVSALERGDVLFATKKFNEAELLFPQSDWAPRASLMAAYSYWTQQYFQSSITELKRFIKIYSSNQNLDYAYYLLGMSYYDSIVDEKTDLRPLLE